MPVVIVYHCQHHVPHHRPAYRKRLTGNRRRGGSGSMKRRMLWMAATTVCSLVVGVPAAQARGGNVHSFAGNCSIEGTVYFTPPATYQQQTLDVLFDGTGTCT